ncbi:hypothetical protein V8F20_001082 [Naviculisporaceae sp. PSN 640]
MDSDTEEEKPTQELTKILDEVFEAWIDLKYYLDIGPGKVGWEGMRRLESILSKHAPYKYVYIITKMLRHCGDENAWGDDWDLDFAREVSVACEELHFNKVSGTTCQFKPHHIYLLGNSLGSVLQDPDIQNTTMTLPIQLRRARLFIITFCQRAEAGWDLSWEELVKDALLVSYGKNGKYLLARELDPKDYIFGQRQFTVYGEERDN